MLQSFFSHQQHKGSTSYNDIHLYICHAVLVMARPSGGRSINKCSGLYRLRITSPVISYLRVAMDTGCHGHCNTIEVRTLDKDKVCQFHYCCSGCLKVGDILDANFRRVHVVSSHPVHLVIQLIYLFFYRGHHSLEASRKNKKVYLVFEIKSLFNPYAGGG